MFRILIFLCVTLLLGGPARAAETSAQAPAEPAMAVPAVVPASDPGIDDAALTAWVALAVNDFLTFSYEDHERRFQQSSAYFTPPGWKGFMDAMKKSHTIDAVVGQKQTSTAQITSPPIVMQKGVLNGKFRWVVSVPFTLIYRDAKDAKTARLDPLRAAIIVERAAESDAPSGIGIAQFIAQVDSGPATAFGFGEYHPPGRLMANIISSALPSGPLDQPGMDDDALLSWSAAAAVRASSFSFADFDESLKAAEKDFTPEGWAIYRDSVLKSDMLKNVIQNQQVVHVAPLAKPSIARQGAKDGAYQWIVSIPLIRTTRAGNNKKTEPAQLILSLTRIKDYPGIAVNNWAETKWP
ncbi:MAG: DotI/IcmL family type IV secretion protein [Alphaproteobacteria bacterium]